jgi:hypothetical protein
LSSHLHPPNSRSHSLNGGPQGARRITRSCVPVLWWDHLALGIFKSFLDNELREGIFGPSAFRSLKEFFTGRAHYEKRSGTVKGLLLGVCFIAKGPVRRSTFERPEQEQCRSYQSGSFVVYFKMHQLKDKMTNRPVITCVMIVIIYRGHECKFTQVALCAYK